MTSSQVNPEDVREERPPPLRGVGAGGDEHNWLGRRALLRACRCPNRRRIY